MTTIRTEWDRTVTVDVRSDENTVLSIVRTDSGEEIRASLNPAQRRTMAAALEPGRGGQWTRDDLMPRREIVALAYVPRERELSARALADVVLNEVVAHLNAHHPKPKPDVSRVVVGGQSPAWVFRALDADFQQALANVEAERDAAVARAERAERERWVHTTPVASRADIEKAIRDAISANAPHPSGNGFHLIKLARAVNAVWALVSGDDPAVHIMRESDIATVKVEQGNNWRANGTGIPKFWTAEQSRGLRDQTAEQWCEIEAIARAIEAEQAVDPVEAKAREIATIAYPESRFEGAFDVADNVAKAAYRRIARHLLWQEGNL